MPVEELAKLVRHAENSMFWVNLPRNNGYQFHRCLRILCTEQVGGTEIRFEMQEDGNVVETVTHKLTDLFGLLPRLAAFLDLQGAPQ
jgi:hypothetical protein